MITALRRRFQRPVIDLVRPEFVTLKGTNLGAFYQSPLGMVHAVSAELAVTPANVFRHRPRPGSWGNSWRTPLQLWNHVHLSAARKDEPTRNVPAPVSGRRRKRVWMTRGDTQEAAAGEIDGRASATSLARLHSKDFYPRRRNEPAGGSSAHELPLVRPSIGPTHDYPVSLRDHILHRSDEVRKGNTVSSHTPAIVVGTLHRDIQRVMADEFIRRESF